MFRTAPSFAAAAVLTLALGLGVNIAVFTISHVALSARLPVAHARGLAAVYTWSPKGGDHADFSYPLYVDLRDSRELDALAAYTSLGLGVAAGAASERVIGELVTANYFEVLGVELTHGPGFSGEDERRGQQVIDSLDYDELAILAESVLSKYEGNSAVLQVLTRKPPRECRLMKMEIAAMLGRRA